MADAIVANELSFTKGKSSKINLVKQKQEVSMVVRSLLDGVTARQRLSVPLAYKWLKFKTGFFGLVLRKGGAL